MRLGKRFSELRAAVYNKYFIRATNSGFSQVINPFGEIIQKLPINTQGYTTVDIYVN
jgi:apolipoprotein N-acyltransferase